MLQHPQQLSISEDSMNFDPTEERQREQQSSQQSQNDQFSNFKLDKLGNDEINYTSKGTTKVYHENNYTRLDTKINLHKINNEIDSCEQREFIKEKKNKDKADRATVEQVLDERTRRILLKLINNEIVSEINGCLSTGKEANVYHAVNKLTNKQYAIKIYKTSILVFKDRDRYVEGEFRFRRGYCSSNPRKMVSMWAEKELRNLKRMEGVLNSPTGLLVKSNVLVMDFIGKDMKNAPRLKDAQVENVEEWSNIYLEVLKIMRILYQECKLIHADFSQYNMLYWEKKVYVIDVSQSVEHDHPHSLDFLRRDITNVNQFFRKKHVTVFSDWHLFQFIVAVGIPKGEQLPVLESLMDQLQNNTGQNTSLEDNIFKKISIPRTLGNIPMEKVEKDLFGESYLPSYHKIVTGIQNNPIKQSELQHQGSDSSSESEDSETSEDRQKTNNQDSSAKNEEQKDGLKDEQKQSKDEKKGGKQKYEGLSKLERKHKVKEEKREKRKDKIPKKEKKRLTKKN